MDFQYLFTSFDGRINRAKYWAGVVILAIISIVLVSSSAPYSDLRPLAPS
jgi:uncharacterized membrane protein YhaH (DUF805 family)